MREINELIGQIQAALEALLKVKASGDKVRVNVLSSEILGHAIRLPELFQKQKRPDMALSNEMELLRVERDAAFLIMRCFGHMTAVRQQSMGAIFQKLLVHIYDSANDGPHYLARDDVYHAYHRIIEEANAYFAQVVFRERLPGRLNETFIAWIHGIASPIRKAAKRYFRDECDAFHGCQVFQVLFEPKAEGVQMGTKAVVHFTDDARPPVTFHVKTHQHYAAQRSHSSDSFGTPSSDRAKLDLKELFVYKVLELMGVGAKVHFIMHQKQADMAFQHNALFIATQDAGYSQFPEKRKIFQPVGALFAAPSEPAAGAEAERTFEQQLETDLASEQITPNKMAATVIDLVARIFRLRDLNAGNIGRVTVQPNKEKWRLIDFTINKLIDYKIGDKRSTTEGFINGNGTLDYSGVDFLTMVLMGRSRMEKIKAGCAAMEMFTAGIDWPGAHRKKMSLEAAVTQAFEHVQQFMLRQQEVKGGAAADILITTNLQALGLSRKDFDDLEKYRQDALYNFHILKAGLLEAAHPSEAPRP